MQKVFGNNWSKEFSQQCAIIHASDFVFTMEQPKLFTNNIIISKHRHLRKVEDCSREGIAREAPRKALSDSGIQKSVFMHSPGSLNVGRRSGAKDKKQLPATAFTLSEGVYCLHRLCFSSTRTAQLQAHKLWRSCGWDNIKLIKWTFLSVNVL